MCSSSTCTLYSINIPMFVASLYPIGYNDIRLKLNYYLEYCKIKFSMIRLVLWTCSSETFLCSFFKKSTDFPNKKLDWQPKNKLARITHVGGFKNIILLKSRLRQESFQDCVLWIFILLFDVRQFWFCLLEGSFTKVHGGSFLFKCCLCLFYPSVLFILYTKHAHIQYT